MLKTAPGSPPRPQQSGKMMPKAYRLLVSGRVQGVGFRPFVFRLARNQGLTGWVLNRVGQVEIHVQGSPDTLRAFTRSLFHQAPPLSSPRLESCTPADLAELNDFLIRPSINTGACQIHTPPDLFTCADCLQELQDPADRRYRYPFINCTQCGPRYTLIRELPYDRPSTTMVDFELCARCRSEYEDPADRRFHAEPLACPDCGPTLTFTTPGADPVAGNEAALRASIRALQDGQIVAVKGIGGYHLMCDARSDTAIRRLRDNKPRAHKPLAVLFPAPAADPLAQVTAAVFLSAAHTTALLSPQRPIVLAQAKSASPLSGLVAPGLYEIGVMLPYSPLHHLLLNDFAAPLVATSANISGEPVLTDNAAVETRLGHVADAFLHHNRPIARPADDPVLRIINDRPRPLRLGRGCAPLEIDLPVTLQQPVLAVGGHMKNTIALAWQKRLVVSPHIGDMGTARSLAVFEQTIQDLQKLYGITAAAVICDAHPGYATSRWAKRCGLPLHKVFHHHAHAAAAFDADPVRERRLVFTWDGAGYGEDGTLWGGEALLGRTGHWQRVASLRPFHLPGGERASREPWRSAAALCWETACDWARLPAGAGLLKQAWSRRVNTPQTSAVGRLFDAAAALTGVCLEASFEGQGPMDLEALCIGPADAMPLPLTMNDEGVWISDWEPLVPMLLDNSWPVAHRAACFHASLAVMALHQAQRVREEYGVTRVGLSGGVFQNRILTEQIMMLLQEDGFTVGLPEVLPVNDAGLSFGQVMEFAMRTPETRSGTNR
ncbi:MAG: carbamoyltransferase HypF [Gammaproteobacteria bacterium]